MYLIHTGCLSRDVTFPASRERNSREILPVPAHRSNMFIFNKLYLFSSTLKIPSFAKSVVGLEGKLFGALNLLAL